MRIIVNHLTRMQRGYMCVAGLEVKTRRHIRPVVRGRLSTDFLGRRLGPFEMAHEIDIGATTYAGTPPEVEDYLFDYRHALSVRVTKPGEFWAILEQIARPRLHDIFGPELSLSGSACTVLQGQGAASLGCLVPGGRPALYVHARPNWPSQVRMHLSDGVLHVDVGVTDIRLYGGDHVTPDEGAIDSVQRRINQGVAAILSVGLTRPYATSPQAAPRHWLQVNNIHLADNPLWPLG